MIQNELKLGLVAQDIVWEDREANFLLLERLFEENHLQDCDVVVLPEMFTTGFSMDAARVAEKYSGKASASIVWMAKWAEKLDACITGSIAFAEGGSCYNRLIWMPPSGNFRSYDKRHLFSFAGEDEAYKAGTERLIVEHKGWRICPLVCYDLRFPVWSKNVLMDGNTAYDLLIYMANWPKPRYNAWQALLQARAIENLSYCIGVNRVGSDANGHEYLGGSLAFDFKGNELAKSANEQGVQKVTISFESQKAFRQKFPALRDAGDFMLIG